MQLKNIYWIFYTTEPIFRNLCTLQLNNNLPNGIKNSASDKIYKNYFIFIIR